MSSKQDPREFIYETEVIEMHDAGSTKLIVFDGPTTVRPREPDAPVPRSEEAKTTMQTKARKLHTFMYPSALAGRSAAKTAVCVVDADRRLLLLVREGTDVDELRAGVTAEFKDSELIAHSLDAARDRWPKLVDEAKQRLNEETDSVWANWTPPGIPSPWQKKRLFTFTLTRCLPGLDAVSHILCLVDENKRLFAMHEAVQLDEVFAAVQRDYADYEIVQSTLDDVKARDPRLVREAVAKLEEHSEKTWIHWRRDEVEKKIAAGTINAQGEAARIMTALELAQRLQPYVEGTIRMLGLVARCAELLGEATTAYVRWRGPTTDYDLDEALTFVAGYLTREVR